MASPSVLRVVSRLELALVTACLALLASHLAHEPPVRESRALALPVPEAAQMRQARIEALAEAYGNAYGLQPVRAERFARWIVAAAEFHDIPVKALSAIVRTESSFRLEAVSSVGAVGPAQVRPWYWADACAVDLLDPADNIWCGAKVLAEYRQQCNGDLECAVIAYNVGPSNLTNPAFQGARQRYQAKFTRYHDALARVSSLP